MVVRKTFVACSAFAATFAAPVCQAQSSVSVYGIMDTSIRHANNAGPNNAKLVSLNDGYFGGSRLGFKGNEDLGSGFKALFVLEMGIDPSTGSLQQSTATANYGQVATTGGRAFGRESWVGLSSDTWGSLTLGRQYTIAHLAASRIQPLGNPNNEAITVLSNHHIARQDNMVKYAKDIGALNFAASVTASESNGRGRGLSAGYSAHGFDLVLYGQNLSAATGGEVRKIRGGGGSYEISPQWKAFAAFMQRSHAISQQKNDVATIGVNYKVLPQLTLTGSYTNDKQNAFAATTSGKRQVVWFSADYYLSKRTDLYAAVDHNKVDGGYVLPAFMGARGSQTGLTFGMRHRF